MVLHTQHGVARSVNVSSLHESDALKMHTCLNMFSILQPDQVSRARNRSRLAALKHFFFEEADRRAIHDNDAMPQSRCDTINLTITVISLGSAASFVVQYKSDLTRLGFELQGLSLLVHIICLK